MNAHIMKKARGSGPKREGHEAMLEAIVGGLSVVPVAPRGHGKLQRSAGVVDLETRGTCLFRYQSARRVPQHPESCTVLFGGS